MAEKGEGDVEYVHKEVNRERGIYRCRHGREAQYDILWLFFCQTIDRNCCVSPARALSDVAGAA